MTTRQSTATKTRKPVSREQDVHYDGEDIRRMIAEAAYYHAEKRGFQGGDMDADWYMAEAEIEAMLLQEKPH